MKNRNRIQLFFCLVMTVIFLGSYTATAASIKDRMVQRLPAITALKDKGLIGENSKGFLEYRTAQQPEKQTVQAENADRSSVYAAIAKKQGVKPTLVGQRRAKQIAEKGGSGHWFQRPNGEWYKK